MDFIIEFLLELILEGSVEAVSSKKVPMPLRIIAGVIFLAVYLGLLLLCVFLCVSFFEEGDWGPSVSGLLISG